MIGKLDEEFSEGKLLGSITPTIKLVKIDFQSGAKD